MRGPCGLRRHSACATLVVGLYCTLFACASTPREGLSHTCDSDRQCRYGLVCRGAPVGQPGTRRCVFEQYEPCSRTGDCYPGRICRSGSCTVQCLADADCLPLNYIRGIDRPDAGPLKEDDYKCVVGECRVGGAERECIAVADCTPGEECVRGLCRSHLNDRCSSDKDCDSGQQCITHRCQ